jgi:2-dehydropantoate 2-reductase
VSSFAIIGAGGLGGFYGGCLARAGHDVHFLIRENLDQVREQGWIVESSWGDFTIPTPNVYNDPSRIPACDFIIVALKSTQNKLLASILAALNHANSYAICLQNGLDVEAATQTIVGPGRVIGGCCFLCSNKRGPGHVQHLDYGRIEIAAYRGPDGNEPSVDDAIINRVVEDFRSARIPIELASDMRTARWRKLMWNVPFNGLSVALDASTADIMQHPASRKLAWELMQEVASGASAIGLSVGDDHANRLMENTDKMVPYDSSMRLDYKAGRPMELEHIFLKPIQAAQQAGFTMNKVEMLYDELCFLESRPRD